MTAVKVGYLGPPGTFGEQAALLYGGDSRLVPLSSHGALVEAVVGGSLDQAVVAIENTLEGSVNDTLDALMHHEAVMFRHELVLPIEQCLVVAPGTRLEDVKLVMSHPVALGQCRLFIEKHLPGARLEAALSTAGAVAAAARAPGLAAIGTARAAELSAGVILARGIQDIRNNKTRFLVLALDDAGPTGDDKTSIAFTVPHDKPGTLMGVLSELAGRALNLTRIESRPSREDLGIYVFLIDFQGHRTEPAASAALDAVRAKSRYFRLLGSYPRFQESPG